MTRGSLPPRPPPVSEHAASHSRFQSLSGRNLKADSGGDGSLDILARKRRVHSRARILLVARGQDGGGGGKERCDARMRMRVGKGGGEVVEGLALRYRDKRKGRLPRQRGVACLVALIAGIYCWGCAFWGGAAARTSLENGSEYQ